MTKFSCEIAIIKGGVVLKTGIFYTSTHGASEEVAKRIEKELPGKVELIDLSLEERNPSGYDGVVIGGGIYAGRTSKKLKEFTKKYHEDIAKMPHGIYICSREEKDKAKSYLRENFHLELLQTSACNAHLGHGIKMKKLNFFTRLLFKHHFNIKEDYTTINENELDVFVDRLVNSVKGDIESE